MSKIRAKFKCEQVTTFEYGQVVGMKPVLSGSEENKSFSSLTPAGELKLQLDKDTPAFDKFKAGKEYYLDFTPAPKTEVAKTEKAN